MYLPGRFCGISLRKLHVRTKNRNLEVYVVYFALQAVLEKVHQEGLAILSLSELQFLQAHRVSLASAAKVDDLSLPAPASWREERRSLIAALQSLKELLARLQTTKDVSRVSVAVNS